MDSSSMASFPCSYYLSSYHQVPNAHYIERLITRDNFYVDFYVSHQYFSPLTRLPLGTPSQRIAHTCITPCDDFLRDCPTLVHTLQFPPSLVPHLTYYARSLIRHRSSVDAITPTPPRLLPLRVDLLFQVPYPDDDNDVNEAEEEAEEDFIEWIMQESIEQHRTLTVPARNDAVASLKRVKVVKGEGEGLCSICLEEFEEGEDASVMPCQHVYHSHCIVQWLQTSHTCPLCRYQMPVQCDSLDNC